MESSIRNPQSEIRNSIVILLSTCPSSEAAAEIARTLVEGRFAACVNIVPGVRSIYRWKESLCDEAEVLLIVKTSESRRNDAMAALRASHPYELPEILAFSPDSGLPEYITWVIGNTR